MRRLFLVLVMLGLPLQSAFPVELLPCVHEDNTGNTFNYGASPIIVDDYPQTIHIEPSMDRNISSNQECGANTLCHVSCSTFIASEISQVPFTNCIHFDFIFVFKSVTFITEQLQRPPLA